MSTLQRTIELARVVLQVDCIPKRPDGVSHLVSVSDLGTSIEGTDAGWRITIDEAGETLLSAEGATLDAAIAALRASVEDVARAVQREIATRLDALTTGAP